MVGGSVGLGGLVDRVSTVSGYTDYIRMGIGVQQDKERKKQAGVRWWVMLLFWVAESVVLDIERKI